jgi:hypothetical protein
MAEFSEVARRIQAATTDAEIEAALRLWPRDDPAYAELADTAGMRQMLIHMPEFRRRLGLEPA